jgi:pyruvate/2-oxoglutarate dehydrogenase complex dihydrolipoamide dehydrogenase (E3) component
MAVEYDLVVVGDTLAGRFAASAAAQRQARVALLSQDARCERDLALQPQTLLQASHCAQYWEALQGSEGAPSPAASLHWARETLTALRERQGPAVLAAQGIDCIQGSGRFQRTPRLALATERRTLRARRYLVATGSLPSTPPVAGMGQVEALTPADLWQPGRLEALPQRVTVVGGTPCGAQIAQVLARLGHAVSWSSETRLLPPEEAATASWVRGRLEAEGVRVLEQAPLTRCERRRNSLTLQAGDHCWETEAVVLATPAAPNVAGLNLEAAGVSTGAGGIRVDSTLRTRQPRIYACGSVLGGYALPNLAQYEAGIALNNALFWPPTRADYRRVPWVVPTDPPLARVGLTARQARRRYGAKVAVLQQSFAGVASALASGEEAGVCRLIVRRDGTLLGGHIVGPHAGEAIAPVALALQQNHKIGALASLALTGLGAIEIVQQTAQQWPAHRLAQAPRLRGCLDRWFELRRQYAR